MNVDKKLELAFRNSEKTNWNQSIPMCSPDAIVEGTEREIQWMILNIPRTDRNSRLVAPEHSWNKHTPIVIHRIFLVNDVLRKFTGVSLTLSRMKVTRNRHTD